MSLFHCYIFLVKLCTENNRWPLPIIITYFDTFPNHAILCTHTSFKTLWLSWKWTCSHSSLRTTVSPKHYHKTNFFLALYVIRKSFPMVAIHSSFIPRQQGFPDPKCGPSQTIFLYPRNGEGSARFTPQPYRLANNTPKSTTGDRESIVCFYVEGAHPDVYIIFGCYFVSPPRYLSHRFGAAPISLKQSILLPLMFYHRNSLSPQNR